MNPLDNATLRRLLIAGASIAAGALNKKLGLDLGTPELAFIGSIAIAYLGGSNWKEATLGKADAAGAAAAAAVTNPVAVLADAAAKEAK